jgi:hypothetical protein
MNGNELITITISDVVEGKEIRLSTRYGLLEADLFNGTKGEFHLMQLRKVEFHLMQLRKVDYKN